MFAVFEIIMMPILISRSAVKNVKHFMSSWVLFKICERPCISNGSLRSELVEKIFLSKVAYSTSSPGLKLDKAVSKLHNTETAKSKCVKNVEKIFNCTREEARILVNDNQHLLYTLGDVTLGKINTLQDIGFKVQTLKENVWILSFEIHELYRHLTLIKKWDFKDVNDAVSMFKLPYKKLEKYTLKMLADSPKMANYGNRIKYFVHHIQCSEKEACDRFVKYHFMFRIDVDYLTANMKILLDVGCKRSWLLRDVQDFRYSPQFLKERVKKIKEVQDVGILDPVKPWMLRCKTDIFERTCNIREEKHAVLSPHTSVTDFLCDCLQLSPEKLEIMMAKHPAVRTVHVPKLKEIIDFLYLEGFNSSHIYSSPRVLCHSLVTLKERLKVLQDHGYKVRSLLTLCKNSKDFKELLQKLQEKEKYKIGSSKGQ